MEITFYRFRDHGKQHGSQPLKSGYKWFITGLSQKISDFEFRIPALPADKPAGRSNFGLKKVTILDLRLTLLASTSTGAGLHPFIHASFIHSAIHSYILP
ncbi:MAG TPA: hypothetical protein VMT35_09835 [Ignavibacteriaceae bacterium]|nr:hypothetical protein [Ignavibacteriaceae bacterium]